MSEKVCGLPTSRTIMSSIAYPNTNVSCSQYGNCVGCRMGGLLSRKSRGNSMFQGKNNPKRRILNTIVSVCGGTGFIIVLDEYS